MTCTVSNSIIIFIVTNLPVAPTNYSKFNLALHNFMVHVIHAKQQKGCNLHNAKVVKSIAIL